MVSMSFKMACRMFDPRKNHPMIFETAIISCTVLIMCPAMSFIIAVPSVTVPKPKIYEKNVVRYIYTPNFLNKS